MEKPYDIRERARLFADDVFAFCHRLRAKRGDCRSMADQLADASGSVGANLAEAKYAQTKKDFIHKNSVALKEANESKYWLQRAWTAEKTLQKSAEPLIQEASELIKIVTSILVTARSNNDRGDEGGGV